MSILELILLGVMFGVFVYFHCVCWRKCGFFKQRKPKPKSGSFIIKQAEKKNVK